MRLLRICVGAFLGGVILASCNPSALAGPWCEVTGVDTLWIHTNDRTDSLPAIIKTEWCYYPGVR
jgi:hypothetical protein